MTLHYLPIRYEDIIDDQEAAVRRMFDFIGEPFDQRCLAFHENRRYADRQLSPSDGTAVRPLALPLSPLPEAAGAGQRDPPAGHRWPRLSPSIEPGTSGAAMVSEIELAAVTAVNRPAPEAGGTAAVS